MSTKPGKVNGANRPTQLKTIPSPSKGHKAGGVKNARGNNSYEGALPRLSWDDMNKPPKLNRPLLFSDLQKAGEELQSQKRVSGKSGRSGKGNKPLIRIKLTKAKIDPTSRKPATLEGGYTMSVEGKVGKALVIGDQLFILTDRMGNNIRLRGSHAVNYSHLTHKAQNGLKTGLKEGEVMIQFGNKGVIILQKPSLELLTRLQSEFDGHILARNDENVS